MLSRARRGEDGRLLGRSTLLLQVEAPETYVPRNRVPGHAFSETDRLTARPDEFGRMPQAVAGGRIAGSTGCAKRLRRTTAPSDPTIR